ncbi:MAG: hypothetical protein ACPGD8_04020 [Flavobacteriales bacterium]
MELLIAFLMTFGVISADDAKSMKATGDAKEILADKGLEKDFIIWEAEADDF